MIHEVDEVTNVGEMELCVPTLEMPNNNEIFVRELPKIRAVSIIHHGSYERLSESYQQITQYIYTNNIHIVGPTREVYIKGPGPILKGNPINYITEILLPIEEIK